MESRRGRGDERDGDGQIVLVCRVVLAESLDLVASKGVERNLEGDGEWGRRIVDCLILASDNDLIDGHAWGYADRDGDRRSRRNHSARSGRSDS